MEITGRILTINVLSEKVAQVVIKKQVDGKVVPIAINLFGFWKDRMEELHLNKGDKIGGRLFIKSKLWKGKYYTDVYFKAIQKIEDKPKNEVKQVGSNFGLFDDVDEDTLDGIGNIIDEETGEILL